MNYMKPIPAEEIPIGPEWMYEIKYDGFRAMLTIQQGGTVTLITKNKHDFTEKFPEIVRCCSELLEVLRPFLPLKLDGELVVLNHDKQANFALIQKRGRLKNKEKIEKASLERPAAFLAFDLLETGGKSFHDERYSERKAALENIFQDVHHPVLQYVEAYKNAEEITKAVFAAKGEGIIAKRKESKYIPGKNHRDWFKIKNWRTVDGFLTAYEPKNGYFTVAVYEGKQIRELGSCKHGFDSQTYDTVREVFLQQGEKRQGSYVLPPAICARVQTLDLYEGELREPNFHSILPEAAPEEFTYEKALFDMAMIPEEIEVSNADKIFWPVPKWTKQDLLIYLREIAPYMLPFLQNRLLTVIRCPDGVEGESFFQKHLPDYAPEFLEGIGTGDEKHIVCNELRPLVWLGNHGAIEYHVPFATVESPYPSEIVFDLDPPGREEFPVAVFAARLLKQLLDHLELTSFVKTSGNKGMQVYIPIPPGSMTYEDTGVFTQGIAWTMEEAHPDLFTTERMKKKRNGKLYIDYVQHGEGKTIIAPYSPRKTKEGTVAAPLFWEEVQENLRPEQFTIRNVVERVKTFGCPFRDYFVVQKKQHLQKVLDFIK